MKFKIKHLLLLSCCFAISAMAQSPCFFEEHSRPFPYKDIQLLNDYFYQSKAEDGLIRHIAFRDSVSRQEMREAFFKHHSTPNTSSPFVNRDSVCAFQQVFQTALPIDNYLEKCPIKEARGLRGVWENIIRTKLVGVTDWDGTPRNDVYDKITKKYGKNLKDWYSGYFITLEDPRPYMGFVVSPHPNIMYMLEKKKANQICYRGPADYFSHSYRIRNAYFRDWGELTKGSAYTFGHILSLEFPPQRIFAEKPCTFSVMLCGNGNYSYNLELLLPETPDRNVMACFENMQFFVNKMHPNLFKPYYTSDGRILMCRYYRITVDERGWLVEDYMNLSE